jgi:GT2 family glycosyltransferase
MRTASSAPDHGSATGVRWAAYAVGAVEPPVDPAGAHRAAVEAIIVTHDDPEAVDRCVAAVLAQTHPLRRIRVVDTAGARPARPTAEAVEVVVHRLDENVGPAGGWAVGLDAFRAGDADLAWLLDDDCRPEPEALAVATAMRDAGDADVVQSRMIDDRTGREAPTQGWCAVLVPRQVVEQVGVPDADLVWWNEDTEYLQWRIPRAGHRVRRCDDAVVHVSLRGDGVAKPAWKYFYEARNQVAYRLWTQRPSPGETRHARHLRLRVRTWRAIRSTGRLAGRALLVEREGRPAKLAAVVRGAAFGLVRRRGRSVPLGEPDRARAAAGSAT